jgi:hypothetical protein
VLRRRFPWGITRGLGQGREYFYTLRNNDFAVKATKTLDRHNVRFGYQMTVQLLNDYKKTPHHSASTGI